MVERIDYDSDEAYNEALETELFQEESERRQRQQEEREHYADYSDQ